MFNSFSIGFLLVSRRICLNSSRIYSRGIDQDLKNFKEAAAETTKHIDGKARPLKFASKRHEKAENVWKIIEK